MHRIKPSRSGIPHGKEEEGPLHGQHEARAAVLSAPAKAIRPLRAGAAFERLSGHTGKLVERYVVLSEIAVSI
jgi:hypothetical protein